MTQTPENNAPVQIRIALGNHPEYEALKDGRLAPNAATLNFARIDPVRKAFPLMVANLAFDISELAAVTFLQARAIGKPLVLLPVAPVCRFHHRALVHDTRKGNLSPLDLEGKRIGVRAYSQGTGVWLRGILEESYCVDFRRMNWVTLQGSYTGVRDPGHVINGSGLGLSLRELLEAGEIDAAIFGNDIPREPWCKPIILEPESAAVTWSERTGVVPINHVVVASRDFVKRNRQATKEVFALLEQAKRQAPRQEPDLKPVGLEAIRPSLTKLAHYARAQAIVPTSFDIEAVFEETSDLLG